MDVNVVSNQDLDLLEEYLDEALPPKEVEQLHTRLACDSDLAEALAELRSQRDLRGQVWAAMEPTDREAQQLASKIQLAARRSVVWGQVGQFARFGSAAAACLLFGFFAGWLGRDQGPVHRPLSTGPTPVNEVIDSPTLSTPYPATPNVYFSEIRLADPQHRPVPMLVVQRVVRGSNASDIGLREGDLLISVDGQPVRDIDGLSALLSTGEKMRNVQLLRNGHIIRLSMQF